MGSGFFEIPSVEKGERKVCQFDIWAMICMMIALNIHSDRNMFDVIVCKSITVNNQLLQATLKD